MKRSSLFFRSIIAFSFAIFALTSCDDTTGSGGTNANPPVIEFQDNGIGSVTNDVTPAPGEELTFQVYGLSGDSPMNNVRFLEDGSLVSDYATRITINGADASTANVLLTEADKATFTWTVTWAAHTDETSKTYAIQIVDEAGNTDEEAIIVNTVSQTELAATLVAGGSTGNSIASDATLTADSYMRVTLDATKGSFPLAFLEVQEDGTAVDANRLYFTDIASGNEFLSNPTAIDGDGVNGFSQDVLVKIHTEEGVTKAYSFLVSDSNGDFEFAQINITTQVTTPVTTPLTNTLSAKLLFNADGPAGKGALDLDFGFGSGVTTDGADATPVDAEIRDMGNDGDGNWLRQIAPMNNATLKRLSSTAEFPVDFAATADKETIVAAYNDATSVDVTVASPGGVIETDMFVIERSGVYYLISCTFINDEAGTNANDYYQFDIKY